MPYFLLILICFFIGCQQQSKERHYTEVTIESSSAQEPVSTGNMVWQVPPGWQQEPGDLMRAASFRLITDPDAFDCSIVSLPGPAGGLPANLKRWMGQIDLEVSDRQLQEFIAASTDNIFDFTKLQKKQPAGTASMIAAVLDVQGTTVFVKLKGSIASVQQNTAAFLSLVRSIHLK